MQLQIDALKEAAAWPGAGRRILVVLASQLMAPSSTRRAPAIRYPLRQHTRRRALAGVRRSVRAPSPRPGRGGDRQAGRDHRPRSRAAALLPENLAGPAPRLRGPRGDRRRPHVPVAGRASPDDPALALPRSRAYTGGQVSRAVPRPAWRDHPRQLLTCATSTEGMRHSEADTGAAAPAAPRGQRAAARGIPRPGHPSGPAGHRTRRTEDAITDDLPRR